MGIPKSNRWTKEKIIREIIRHEFESNSVRPQFIRNNNPSLYNAALRQFGRWSQALVSAGVPARKFAKTKQERMNNRKFWTKDRIIEAILQRAVKNHSLQSTQIRPYALRMAGIKYFGSWANAVKAAGLNPADHGGVKIETIGS
jgi:hypothetical protein